MQTQLICQGIEGIESYQRVLSGNKNYVAKKLQLNPNYFKELSKGQNPKYLLIGCADSRVPPNELTETDPGEIFIHRNIANLVIPTDLNINCVIQYAVEHLKVHNIIIMGHTYCGGVKAAMQQDSVGGMLDLWLNQIKMTYEKNQEYVDSFEDPDERVNCLCALNVREQVSNIWKNPIIQKSWQNGHPVMVHGWLCRVETGFIEEVSIDHTVPESLSRIFTLKFKNLKISEQDPAESPVASPRGRRPTFSSLQSKLEKGIKQNTEISELKMIMMQEEQ